MWLQNKKCKKCGLQGQQQQKNGLKKNKYMTKNRRRDRITQFQKR